MFDEKDISKDDLFDCLTTEGPFDDIVLDMLKHSLLAIRQTLRRMTADFLPGGDFNKKVNDEYFCGETKSVPRHNKLPERIFGYFHFLMSMRPNSSDATNEAQIM